MVKDSDQKREEYRERIERVREKRNQEKRESIFKRMAIFGQVAYKFVTSDIWRLYDTEMEGVKGWLVRIIRVIYISIHEFISGKVSQKASALTYTTLLSLVPVLVIILSIAGGFGVQASVQRLLYETFPAHQQELTRAFDFVEAYMDLIHGGVVIGIGIIVLIYTVFSTLMTVESVFNDIWQVKKGRSFSKRFIGYLAAFFIIPLALILISLSNIFIGSLADIQLIGDVSLTPLVTILLKVLPIIVLIAIVTIIYMTLPNTRVKFFPAFIAGIIGGVGFQVFQIIYISGVLWVARYNSIYGSFAALPLLMLFVQLSWMIILFGAQVSFAMQNVTNYAFKSESENVSRRFCDFVAILVVKKICKAFRYQEKPYNARRLADECQLPIVIVQDMLYKLTLCHVITEIIPKKRSDAIIYMPATEITALTVKRVITSLDRLGSENFRVDLYDEYANEWELVRLSRQFPHKDLEIPLVDL